MILVIDNYDSFTYNLVQLVGKFTSNIKVIRNRDMKVNAIAKMRPDGIIISPGPGRPEEAGISIETVRKLGKKTPILGVCLGHQAIGTAFGATITYAPAIMHGRASKIFHKGETILKSVPNPLDGGRYHSLIISQENFPDELIITAYTKDGMIMGIRHKEFPVEGIQFHPESVLTKEGEQIINNWMEVYKIL